MDQNSTDEELMRAYQNGSEEAFSVLFKRHSPRVYGFLLKQLRDRAKADDVFQNTFLKLHQTRSHYDPAFPFQPWLFTVCKSVMVDFIRQQKRGEAAETQEFPALETPDASTRAVDIEALPESQRRVIDLRFKEDLDFDEIAKRLETSPANVRQILSRAIRKLRGLALQGGKK